MEDPGRLTAATPRRRRSRQAAVAAGLVLVGAALVWVAGSLAGGSSVPRHGPRPARPRAAADVSPRSHREDRTASLSASPARHLQPVAIDMKATDPAYVGGFQVGDTLTVQVAVVDPNTATTSGVVSVTSNDHLTTGCAREPLRRSTATCYLTFYDPGRHRLTARFTGGDGARATVSAVLDVVPNTSD